MCVGESSLSIVFAKRRFTPINLVIVWFSILPKYEVVVEVVVFKKKLLLNN